MKKMFFTSMIAVFLLGACNTMNSEDNTRQGDGRTGVEQTRYNDENMTNQGMGNDQRITNERQGDNRNEADRERNGQYEVSQEAADAITDEISEIQGAYVITMGSNAYVAAMFTDDQGNTGNTGNTNQGNAGNISEDNTGNIGNQGRDRGTDNRNMRDNDGVFDGQMNESDQLTDDLKERIASIVRDQDDTITHVHVTTNPEFSNLTRAYMDDIDNGRPVRGFFDQIGTMIERVFPQNQR